MNFSCDKCQRRYSIADEKVRGKTVKVRCKNCQNVISVQGPPQEMEESTRVVSLADVERLREQERSLAASQASAPAAEAPWGEEEPTRAAPGRPSSVQWFVMVKSKQEGPLDEAGLSALVANGTVSPRSFFWQQGMADWKRGSDVPELAGIFAPPAAAPAPVPTPLPMATPAPSLSAEPVTTSARGARGGAASRAQPEPAPQADPPWEEAPAPDDRAPWDLDPPAEAEPKRARSEPEPEPDDETGPQGQAAWNDSPDEESKGAWDEPEQPQRPWSDEPEQPTAPQSKNAGMGDLFSDLDLPLKGDGDETGPYPPEGDDSVEGDPLAHVPGGKGTKDGKPVEDTRHFMVQSGVTRRNPIWKVALFILIPVGLVVGGVFAADRLNFVPKVKVVNAKGETVEKSLFFSGEGVSELRDRLMGRKPASTAVPPPAVPPAEKKPQGAQKPGAATPPPATPEMGKAAGELETLYEDSAKEDVGPAVREEADLAGKDSAGKGGPPQEEVLRVVANSQGAIQGCVEKELRKNPSFRGGKVVLTATVGTSGAVKKASLDRKELDKSPVGDCIKKSAKRMVFPAFEAGEDVDLEIPLVLSSGTL
ncbi:AgmX/PglI C-terminal domain-containing protein [Stigmatella sp. ncwal1]|uniref:AgmX/PglI C-terminal domain-containing protein n=1 Tax=Stigmatella ashevillensis TaxID=2995309 RepID=A0ABT5D7T7_9BACT|nr:AgmX/PglI C-terminal domain-containing protein [Stigmatella ashevillena]MDC0709717.1 AgmX/PglI C-terminal domain-containing protein [Stigmatella ashevillena]